MKKVREDLLADLFRKHPNAYVVVGETVYPVRSELFAFEMFKNAEKHSMYKRHNDLPIILSLKEADREIYESFEEYLLYNTSLKVEGSKEYQLACLLFLNSFCNTSEMMEVLDVSAQYCKVDLFSLDVWTEIMDLEINPDFLSWYDKLEIIAIIHRGKKFPNLGIERAYAVNDYGKSIQKLDERTLEEKEPVLFKALKFYRRTLADLKQHYPYKKFKNGSNGPN